MTSSPFTPTQMPGGDSIFLNYANCGNVAEELALADQNVVDLIDNLMFEVQPLEASWLGVSEDEYAAVKAKWTQHMLEMQSVLTQFAPTLDEMVLNVNHNDIN